MRVGIVAIGRMKQGPERELVARYLERAINSGKTLGLTNFAVTEFPDDRTAMAALTTGNIDLIPTLSEQEGGGGADGARADDNVSGH